MQKGSFLYFKPPMLSGNSIGTKNRYMLIVEDDQVNNVIKMINVSSLKGKEHNLLYNSNIEITNYPPLPVPTFAKLNTLYIIDYFEELENYVAFKGQMLDNLQFQIINSQRLEYMTKKDIEIIQYTETEFKKYNK